MERASFASCTATTHKSETPLATRYTHPDGRGTHIFTVLSLLPDANRWPLGLQSRAYT